MSSKIILVLSFVGLCLAQWDPNFAPGRSTIVHLFEWKWNTIAEECEQFLGPYGYGGIQVSPVNENAVISSPFRPWYERYQSVSYNVMTTRSGTEEEFKDMVKRCNDVGVRIYVDLIINHMTGSGMSGVGTGGSRYNGGRREYPEYSAPDFNGPEKCPTASGNIEDFDDVIQVRNCALVSLVDLDQSKEYVRQHIAEFMNKLTGYGVAGFRVDAGRHMWPEDEEAMFSRLNNLNTSHGFAENAKPLIYQEVIDYSHGAMEWGGEYFPLGRITDFRFGSELGRIFRGENQLRWLVNWGTDWGLPTKNHSVVFIDNHDNQRGHPNGPAVTFRMARKYKMATAFMLAHPFSEIARIMSSFNWEENWDNGVDTNSWMGPPNVNGEIVPPTFNPDMSCGNGWICEHRWRPIYGMVGFRKAVEGTALTNWWDNQSNQIAFCRGDKGFIAINGDNTPLAGKLQTCLSPGEYCDVVAGAKVNGECTGATIRVEDDGTAQISLTNLTDDPILAIHVESKL